MQPIAIPVDVHRWLIGIFDTCNTLVTEKLCNNPNLQEEWLDYSWIEVLSRFSTPLTLASGWTVRMQAHYLGGMRHFHQWEVADIGVLLFIRSSTRVERSKVVLLQSKRLYPRNRAVAEETPSDYMIGFGRLADPEDLAQSLAFETDYQFTDESRFGALEAKSDQIKAMKEHEKHHNIPIYYQFYNPPLLPFARRVPIDAYRTLSEPPALGVRIVPAKIVHRSLAKEAKGYRPMFKEISAAGLPDTYGWRLEEFMADEFLSCREGAFFESVEQPSIDSLFNRRSGPIAAAISISVEAPAGVLD